MLPPGNYRDVGPVSVNLNHSDLGFRICDLNTVVSIHTKPIPSHGEISGHSALHTFLYVNYVFVDLLEIILTINEPIWTVKHFPRS